MLNSGIEDITPPSSTGYEEDEEYEDTETDTNDEDYGEGFGPQYNMPVLEDDTSGRLTDNIGGGMVKILLRPKIKIPVFLLTLPTLLFSAYPKVVLVISEHAPLKISLFPCITFKRFVEK